MRKRSGSCIFIAIILVLIIVGIKFLKTEKEIAQNVETQEKALKELEDYEGLYNAQRILLADTSKAEVEKIAQELNADLRSIKDGSFATLYLPKGTDIKSVYENESYKEYLEKMSPDYFGTLSSSEESKKSTEFVNELSFSDVSNYIDLGTTWDVTKGAGTKVAVIDVGVDTDNSYISSKISMQSFNASEGKVVADYDFSVIEAPINEKTDADGNTIQVQETHGTQVASLIAADYNEELGVGGVAPATELVIIKLNTDEKGRISSSDVIFGIAYAIECDVDVINMSFSFETEGNPFEKYTQLAIDSDIICVAAAGNNATSVQVWPAADENVIGVGAVTIDDGQEQGFNWVSSSFGSYEEPTLEEFVLADSSNYGTNTDVVALEGVVTPLFNENGEVYTESFTDTSCSSAMISGALTLYLSQNNNVEFPYVKEVLYAASKDIGTLGVDWYYGCGLLDINALVIEQKGVITYDFLTAEYEPETHVFVRGHTLQSVLEPERNYQVFDGWYSDIHCTDEYDNLTDVLYDDLTVYASWVNEDDTEPYTYIVKEDGTAEITSYTGKRKYITVPGIIDGYVVTSIGEHAFEGNQKLRRVNLPNTLTQINGYAFANMSALRSMEVPSNVKVIGESAFEGCSCMGTITFEENSLLNTVGDYAFSKCGSIRRVDLPAHLSSINASAFNQDNALTTIMVDENNNILDADGVGLYKNDSEERTLIYYATGKSGSYTVDGETDIIGSSAFAFSRVTEVILPEGLVEIEGSAFVNTGIQSIVIPNNVRSISAECFMSSGLKTISLGNSVQSIGNRAFYNCSNLLQVIPASENTLMSVGAEAFNNAAISDIAFLGEKIKSISVGAFYSCDNISKIYLPSSLQELGMQAFERCTGLNTLEFSKEIQITSIPLQAFYGCEALTSIAIPEGVDTLGEKCFASTGLESIYISSTVTSIGNGSFANCDKFMQIEVDDNNEVYSASEGVMYMLDEESGKANYLHTYPAGKNETSFTLPDEVEIVGEDAFVGASYLTKVILAENVIIIEKSAFASCENLASVQFNEGLLTIGESAFKGCGLLSVEFNEFLETIGDGAFSYCTKLKKVVFNEKLTHVSEEAFAYDASLVDIQFKEGLIEVGKGAFANCTTLENINFPESLQTIGTYSFANCSSLKELLITKNIISIGAYAFKNDYALSEINFDTECVISRLNYAAFARVGITSVTIPSTVSSMGQEIFTGCTNLRKVEFEENSKLKSIAAWTFEGSSVKEIIFGQGSALEHIEAKAFSKVTSLTTLDVTECKQLSNIDNYAFEYCKALTNFIVPENVEKVGRYAFYNCDSLTTLVMPETLKTIGRYAFASIPNITVYFDASVMPENLQEYWDYGVKGYYLGTGEVYTTDNWEYTLLSDGTIALVEYLGTDTDLIVNTVDGYTVSVIGANMLTKNSTVQTLVLPETITTICAHAFDNAINLAIVNIPASVTFMGDYAFYNTGLKQIEFEGNSQIKKIPAYAFAYTKNLTNVNIPETVTDIGTYAFNESGLTELSFNEKSELTYVGKFAFAETCIKQLVFPDNVAKLDEHAFEGIEELESVSFGSTKLQLRGYVFYNTGLRNLFLPASVEYVGEYCFAYCENLTTIEVDSENPYYAAEENVLFNKAGTRLLVSPAGKTGVYTIPNAVEVLAAGAFEGSRMTSININDNSNLRTIGLKAFYDCKNLTSMYIPENIQSIDYYAFAYCTSLESVEVSEKCQLTGIYEGAFYGCEGLQLIVIPETVVEIGEYAFYGCDTLQTVNISDKSVLEGIYEYAFAYCSALQEINLPAELIDLEKYAFRQSALTNITIPGKVQRIGDGCFLDCTQLASMTLAKADVLQYSNLNDVFGESTIPIVNLIVSEGTAIPEAAFSRCENLVSVQLPESVSVIEKSAFSGCSSLREITALHNVVELGDSAFYNCSSLTAIDGLALISEVGENTFSGCSSLSEIAGLENVEIYGAACFRECSALVTMNFENAIKIGDSAFYGTGLTMVELPAALETLGRYAFGYASKLSTVVIPDGCLEGETISNGAFYSCPIVTLNIGEGAISIGSLAFKDCIQLQELTLPDSVTKIEYEAFRGCTSLSVINWGTGLKTLERYAFGGNALRRLIVPDGVETIGQSCFVNSKAKVAYIPASVKNADAEIFGSFTLDYEVFFEAEELPLGIVLPEDTKMFFSSGKYYEGENLHYLRSEKGIAILDYTGEAVELDLYAIENVPVWAISKACFLNAPIQKLTGIDGIEYIGESAFEGCNSLKIVELSKASRLAYIGEKAFYNCLALQPIDISNSVVTELFHGTFYYCNNLTTISLPNTLQRINSNAFMYCGLETITLPVSVTFIDNLAFQRCGNLKTIEMNGVKTIGNSAFYNCYSLQNISMDSVVVMGNSCFKGCQIEILELPETYVNATNSAMSGVKQVIFADTIESIDSGVFDSGTYVFFRSTTLPATLAEDWSKGITYILGYIDSGLDDDTKFRYIMGTEEVIITGYGGNEENIVVDKIKGVPITKIEGGVFYRNETIRTVVVGDSVTYIGANCFSLCSKLERVCLPTGITKICDGLFSQCYALEEVKLPECITEIGASAFYQCRTLEGELNIPENVTFISDEAFLGCSGLTKIVLPETLSRIGKGAFAYCDNLTEINLPDKLTEISYQLFYETPIESVTIPNNVTSIGGSAFIGCAFMEMIIPDSVIEVGDYAFAYNDKLEGVKISSNLSILSDYMFYNCTNLKKIDAPGYIKSIGQDAFTGTNLFETVNDITYVGNFAIACTDNTRTNYSIREGTTILGENLFKNCTSLTDITVPESVYTISDYAFYNCTALTSVKGMQGIKSVGNYVFSGCTNLTDVTFGEEMQELGYYSFENCSSITILKLPSSVEKIAWRALYGLTNLEELHIPTIENSSGQDNTLANLFAKKLYTNNIPSTLTKVVIVGDITTIPAGSFSGCENIESIKLPSTIKNIGNSAFSSCSSLKEVNLPRGLESIGYMSFYNCKSLEELELPDGIKMVGERAFRACSGLSKMVFPDSLESIGYGVLEDCKNIESITIPFFIDEWSYITNGMQEFFGAVPSSHLKSVTINGDITEIPAYAFAGCKSLEMVIMSDTIETIGYYAFQNCNIQNMKWSANLKTIAESAFYNGYKADNLVLPEGVQKIQGAFGGCSFEYVIIPSTVTTLSSIPSASEELRIYTTHLSLNTLINNLSCKRLVLPNSKKYTTDDWPVALSKIISSAPNLESILLMDTTEMVTEDALEGFSGINIYCFEDALSTPWPDGWDNGNTVFYKDKWRDITFWSDEKLLTTCTQALGDPIKIPAKVLREKGADDFYAYSFVGWDIDGDAVADKLLSTTARNMIVANAVYSAVAKKQIEELRASAPVEDTEGNMQIVAKSENTEIEKTIASITSEDVDSIAGKNVSIETNLGMVTFDQVATENIDTVAGKNQIELTIEKVNNELISFTKPEDRLYNLDLSVDGSTIAFGDNTDKNGIATIAIPCKIDSPENLMVYYIDESGEETEVPASYDAKNETVLFETNHFSLYRITTETDEFEEPASELAFSGASLTLQNNLTINYKAKASLFNENGYSNPYVIFTFDGVETRVTDYTVVGDNYVFDFTDIVPHQMNNIIYAQLFAKYNDVEYSSKIREYSVATYCYNMLDKYYTDDYAELRTLLVDLLNYGAKSQLYMAYDTEHLVNNSLTVEQMSWGTSEDRELTTVQDIAFEEIENPTVIWKGGGLNLQDSVAMRFKIATDNIEGLTVKIRNESGIEWTISSEKFEMTDGGYYLYFDGLNAGQMSENVYLTVYRGDTAVSNTVRYSIESYAYTKLNDEDETLVELVKAMMKYGDAARLYAN